MSEELSMLLHFPAYLSVCKVFCGQNNKYKSLSTNVQF